jgi:predicted TIM-barrel fold metal-dependent hydrolase
MKACWATNQNSNAIEGKRNRTYVQNETKSIKITSLCQARFRTVICFGIKGVAFMRPIALLATTIGLIIFVFLTLSLVAQNSSPASQPDLSALAALDPIDSHTHVTKGDPSFYAMLDRLHMHILDILLVDDHDPYRRAMQPQLQDAWRIVHDSHGHAALCTTIDPFQFGQKEFSSSAVLALNHDFSDGALAVKIWKNMGMELKDPNGRYVMPDDSALQPILADIESHNRTLVIHAAEPDEAWLPPNPNGLDYSYYKDHPTWYMYQHPEAPKKQQILAARDHLLAQNPKLRVVGAHLGSMEDDLAGLSERLDRYPNFAVDVAARVVHLVVQPNDKVRNFILKYQDRLLYATDLEFLRDEQPRDALKEWQTQYAQDWHYFATSDSFDYDGHQVHGLALPERVLRKLYHDNATHWIPGIESK